jgi:hypothetical protein
MNRAQEARGITPDVWKPPRAPLVLTYEKRVGAMDRVKDPALSPEQRKAVVERAEEPAVDVRITDVLEQERRRMSMSQAELSSTPIGLGSEDT